MRCSQCRDLYRVLVRTQARYLDARSSAFFMVSTEIAAKKQIDMERAKNDLHEHQLDCAWAKVARAE